MSDQSTQSAARQALTAWTGQNLPSDQASALSKLVARYVAECVRNDRAKFATEFAQNAENLQVTRGVEDMMRKFNNLARRGPFP